MHTLTQNARQLPARSIDCTTTGTCSSANKRLDLSYAFDANGNVGQITDNTSGGQQTRSMTYDALDRLTGATSPMFGTATYAYDALDNLTRVKLTGGSQVRDHYYCYDTSGRLGNIKTGSCSGATVIGLGYDVQGNLANKSGQTYSFDYGNRLRTVAGKEDQYHYDGHGRRALSVRRVNGSSWLRSIYSLEGQLLFQQDQGANERIDYIYLGGSLVAERKRPNTAATPLTVTYQHTDALGSPIAVTDGAKAIVEQTEYEPYGQVLNRGLRTGPGYTGHMEDVATGMNYMQQRYYDPSIGRFLSVDPITADGADGDNFNRYWYANNNPYKFTDPDGRLAGIKSDWRGDYYEDWMGNRQECNFCLAQGSQSSAPKPNNTTSTGRVDLLSHEGVDGAHTVSEHVGKSDTFLLNRMKGVETGYFTAYKRAHSTFPSLEAANKLVSATLAANQAKVAAWSSSPFGRFMPQLVVHQSFNSPTGRVAFRQGNSGFMKPGPVQLTTGRGVTVVLKRSPSAPTGYVVYTSYPTIK